MKILCLGRHGNSRSVALAYLLKQKGHEAIAGGMRCMNKETRETMCKWADLIISVHQKCCEGVPEEYHSKMKVWPIGRDVYFKGFDKILIEILEVYIKREKL